MKAIWSVSGLGAWGLLLGAGCGGSGLPAFAPPGAGAPHAVVEVRTHYALPPANDGRVQREAVFVEGLHVLSRVGSTPGGYTRTVLVSPGATTWTVEAVDNTSSSHMEARDSPFIASCGINPVCMGVLSSDVRVGDLYPLAGCTTTARLTVESGSSYLIDYRLSGMGMCEITCSRRTSASGAAESIACPVAPPRPQTAPLRPAR
jgi:hypothetical protein